MHGSPACIHCTCGEICPFALAYNGPTQALTSYCVFAASLCPCLLHVTDFCSVSLLHASSLKKLLRSIRPKPFITTAHIHTSPWSMRFRPLRSANTHLNTQINRHAWVSWLFIYTAELTFFSAYRLSNLGDLVKASTIPDEDSAPTRIYGVLLGIVQDFVVISFLISVLSGFDAAINRSACCNDTAPNGCLDCFTRGIPFRSRVKLVFKRFLRYSVIYSACLLSVVAFAKDMVAVRCYRRRYEFGWDWDNEKLVVTTAEESRIISHVLIIVLVTQGIIAIVTTVWCDLTRWTPFRFAKIWPKSQGRQNQELPTLITSRPFVNYHVMDSDNFFDSDDNENLSEFFDSNNRPIRGTQPPQPPAILSDDRRDLPSPRLECAMFGLGLALVIFIVVPLLVLLIRSYCPPAVANIALNSNLNEPIRTITTLSLV